MNSPQVRSGNFPDASIASRAHAHDVNNPHNTDLRRSGRGLARGRWTSVATSTGVGIVLVALSARLDPVVAIATAVFVVVAIAALLWHAAMESRRWRHALRIARDGGGSEARDASPP